MSSAIQSALVIESFDTLASRPVIWLWKFRLAMGKLAIFAHAGPAAVELQEAQAPQRSQVGDAGVLVTVEPLQRQLR